MSAARMCTGSTAWLEAAEAMENADCRASCALIVSVFIFICRFLLLLFSVFLLQQIICQSWLLSFCHVWQSGLLRRSLSGEYVCPAGLERGWFGVSGIGGQAAVTVSAFAVKRRTGRLSAFPFSAAGRSGFVIRLSGYAGVRPFRRSPWRRAGGYEGSSCSWKGFQTSHRS